MFKRIWQAIKQATSVVHPAPIQSLMLPRTTYDYEREVGDGYRSSVVTAPLKFIQRSWMDSKLTFEDLQREETLDEHELLSLIAQPNPYYSGDVLWSATLASYVLQGNAYWLKVRNSQLKPVELWWAPPWLIAPKWPVDGSEFISHYEYRPGYGNTQLLEPGDVVHFRNGINPANPRLGLSDLHALYREIFTDDEAANFSASLLKNSGLIGVIISPEMGIGVDDEEAARKHIEQKFGGDNRGRFAIAKGPTKVQEFGIDPKSMELSNIRNIPEERVCAELGIQAAVVGFGTGLEQTKVGATMRESIQLSWKNGIIPRQKMLAADITTSLLPDFEEAPERFRLYFDNTDVEALQESQNDRIERLSRAVTAGWLDVYTARLEAGFEAEEQDKVYLRSVTVLEIPADGARATMTRVEATQDEPKQLKAARGTRRQRQFILALERQQRSFISAFTRELEPFFDSLGKETQSVAREVLKHSKWLTKEAVEDEIVADEIIAGLNLTEREYELRQMGSNHYLRIGEETFGLVSEIFGIELNMPDPVSTEILAAGGRNLGLVDLTGQTRDRLFTFAMSSLSVVSPSRYPAASKTSASTLFLASSSFLFSIKACILGFLLFRFLPRLTDTVKRVLVVEPQRRRFSFVVGIGQESIQFGSQLVQLCELFYQCLSCRRRHRAVVLCPDFCYLLRSHENASGFSDQFIHDFEMIAHLHGLTVFNVERCRIDSGTDEHR